SPLSPSRLVARRAIFSLISLTFASMIAVMSGAGEEGGAAAGAADGGEAAAAAAGPCGAGAVAAGLGESAAGAGAAAGVGLAGAAAGFSFSAERLKIFIETSPGGV